MIWSETELAGHDDPPRSVGLVRIKYPRAPIQDLMFDKLAIRLRVKQRSKLVSCHLMLFSVPHEHGCLIYALGRPYTAALPGEQLQTILAQGGGPSRILKKFENILLSR
jgi:hypothetical protein